MRLQELFETTVDDREISKLSTQIYNFLSTNFGGITPGEDEIIHCGTVGEICNLPPQNALSDIPIELLSDESLKDGSKDLDSQRSTVGAWQMDRNAIVFNQNFMGSNKLKTTIAHELRHALDDKKSAGRANSSAGYTTPRKKEHRVPKDDQDNTPYLAEPAEINARVMEVQHQLAGFIPRIYQKFEPNQIKSKITQYIKRLLEEYRIAELFPEGTESKQYKQLIKRIMSFTQEEMRDQESQLKKSAQGNW